MTRWNINNKRDRREVLRLEKEFMSPLPDKHFEYFVEKQGSISYNYHVSYEKTWYSVPWQYALDNMLVTLRIYRTHIEVFDDNGNNIASHKRLFDGKGRYVTAAEHMPSIDEEIQCKWSRVRIEQWALSIGPETFNLIKNMLNNAKYPPQAYRGCIAALQLSGCFTNEVFENACRNCRGIPSFGKLKNALMTA